MAASPITSALATLVGALPGLRRSLWRFWYDGLARHFQQTDWTFMNFGYAEPGLPAPGPRLEPVDEPDRFCIQLYDHLVAAVDLRDRKVLEVGCGRGGGCSYLARYRGPSSVVGMDLSPRAVALCQRLHSLPNLQFVPGDAEALPWKDAVFDVVVNVESSHCYPSFRTFVGEVFRVLRPGGHFLWTDGVAQRQLTNRWRAFDEAGFHRLREQTITAAVLHALDLTTDRKAAYIRRHVPRLFRGPVHDFAGIVGTKAYEAMRTGEGVYVSCVLQKPRA